MNSAIRLWFAALKPPMYSVAVIPITTGAAIAFRETHSLNWDILLKFLGAAVLLLLWENLSNDVFDAETGVDLHKAHSVVNLTGQREAIAFVANLCLIVGIGGIASIALAQGDGVVLTLVLLCCVLGYLYQGPPFRWGYRGWGEILCFWSFGPLATTAAFYSQTGYWSPVVVVPAGLVGAMTSIILLCSHFHQVADDRAAGKYSPVVQLGTERAMGLVLGGWVSIYTLLFLGAIAQILPWTCLLMGLGIPSAWQLCQLLRRYHAVPNQVSQAKFVAVAAHFWSGLGLGAGFWLAALLA